MVDPASGPDMDWQGPYADPDPAKWCPSDRIRIHNTVFLRVFFLWAFVGFNTCNVGYLVGNKWKDGDFIFRWYTWYRIH